jgi:hypothetical protein
MDQTGITIFLSLAAGLGFIIGGFAIHKHALSEYDYNVFSIPNLLGGVAICISVFFGIIAAVQYHNDQIFYGVGAFVILVFVLMGVNNIRKTNFIIGSLSTIYQLTASIIIALIIGKYFVKKK